MVSIFAPKELLMKSFWTCLVLVVLSFASSSAAEPKKVPQGSLKIKIENHCGLGRALVYHGGREQLVGELNGGYESAFSLSPIPGTRFVDVIVENVNSHGATVEKFHQRFPMDYGRRSYSWVITMDSEYIGSRGTFVSICHE